MHSAPTLYVDECLGRGIAARLQAEGHDASPFDEFAGKADVDFLPIIGERQWVLVTKDKNVRKNQLENLRPSPDDPSNCRSTVFQSANEKPVVLTLGVPQPVPGSDWGCALQITGMKTSWRRPKDVFGIDGLQALHLAMKCATAALASAESDLEWLGRKGDAMLPRFLPGLPRKQRLVIVTMYESPND